MTVVGPKRTHMSPGPGPHRTQPSPAAAPSPPPEGAVLVGGPDRPPPGQDADDWPGAGTLHVVAWPDPVVEALGVDPRSTYAEHFWLPLIGPTATWLLRRLAARFDKAQEGFTIGVDETARALGLSGRRSRHSPFARAVGRCVRFELARWCDRETLAVRRALPPLARRQLCRLPPVLQEAHRRWTVSALPARSVEVQRSRARRLALGLVALGEGLEGAEGQLLRWGVHPALTGEAVRWARRLEQATVPS